MTLQTHAFNSSCLFYSQLPDDLRAHWRRWIGSSSKAMPTIADWWVIGTGRTRHRSNRRRAYFPAPLVALRTLKCELALGLRPGNRNNCTRLIRSG